MTRTGSPAPRPRGVALILALVMLVALTLLANATLLLARVHRRVEGLVAAAASRQLEARALVVAAAAAMDSLPTAEILLPAAGPLGGEGSLRVRRLSPEVALLVARVDSVSAVRAAGALVWALDPALRIALLPRALEVGDAPGPAGTAAVEPGVEAPCEPDTPLALGPRPLVGLVVRTGPGAVDPLSLGRLGAAELERRLTPLSGARGTPTADVSDCRCVAGDWNWGSPATGDSPCAGRYVGRAAGGDLELFGGEGQGVLWVRGSLTLSGTRLSGLLLVGGDLTLNDGALFEGVARVGGTLNAADGSRLVGLSCQAVAALERVGSLRQPLVLARPGWSRP